jgi:hypothetical protein
MEFYIETDRVHFLIDAEVYCDFCLGDNVTPPGGDFEITSWHLLDIFYFVDDIKYSEALQDIINFMETQPSELTDQIYQQCKRFNY